MPQYIGFAHYTKICLQLNNNPPIYLKSTPHEEPKMMKTVNKPKNYSIENYLHLNNNPLG